MRTPVEEVSYMVIDFETVTPKGIPPEPIQLGLVQIDDLEISLTKQKSWFIKPPANAPLTHFDTAQTGIVAKDLQHAKVAKEIFDVLEGICTKNKYIFVAQNANYEREICKRFYEGRPNLSKVIFVDTIKLAKLAFTKEKTYKLDHIAELLGIAVPANRHTALGDCVVTGNIFIKLINILDIKSVEELLDKAGINYEPYEQMSILPLLPPAKPKV